MLEPHISPYVIVVLIHTAHFKIPVNTRHRLRESNLFINFFILRVHVPDRMRLTLPSGRGLRWRRSRSSWWPPMQTQQRGWNTEKRAEDRWWSFVLQVYIRGILNQICTFIQDFKPKMKSDKKLHQLWARQHHGHFPREVMSENVSLEDANLRWILTLTTWLSAANNMEMMAPRERPNSPTRSGSTWGWSLTMLNAVCSHVDGKFSSVKFFKNPLLYHQRK